jgi:hypothetical protein
MSFLAVDPDRAVAAMDQSDNRIAKCSRSNRLLKRQPTDSSESPQARGPEAVAASGRADLEILPIGIKEESRQAGNR